MLFLSPIKGGVDAKELFHLYIMVWIQDKRLALLESCKLDKVICPTSMILYKMEHSSLMQITGSFYGLEYLLEQ